MHQVHHSCIASDHSVRHFWIRRCSCINHPNLVEIHCVEVFLCIVLGNFTFAMFSLVTNLVLPKSWLTKYVCVISRWKCAASWLLHAIYAMHESAVPHLKFSWLLGASQPVTGWVTPHHMFHQGSSLASWGPPTTPWLDHHPILFIQEVLRFLAPYNYSVIISCLRGMFETIEMASWVTCPEKWCFRMFLAVFGPHGL